MKSGDKIPKFKSSIPTISEVYTCAAQGAMIRFLMLSLETLSREPYNWSKKRLSAFVNNLMADADSVDLSGTAEELLIYMEESFGVSFFKN